MNYETTEARLGALREEAAAVDAPVALQEAGTGAIARNGNIFDAEGAVKIAVIRPCVSRGKQLRGLPPIYTPAMLEANAHKFAGWVMFSDHMVEGLAEAAEDEDRFAELLEASRRTRSIHELGGRIIESWWDPSYTHRDDAKYGHMRGAVIGRAIPQPKVRAMLEADPDILHVSINAFPTGARAGVAPWDSSKQGMLIEGILDDPPGSVDWVIRPGAGGRVLREDEQFALSLLEGLYPSGKTFPPEPNEETMDFSKMTDPEVQEWLRENRPGLMESVASPAPAPVEGVVTETRLEAILEEHTRSLTSGLREALAEATEEAEAAADERAESRMTERETAHELSALAGQLIESSDLPARWKADLRKRYSVTASGPSPALLLESDAESSAEEKLRESVEADVAHALDLINDVTPKATVTGQGGTTGGSITEAARSDRTPALMEFLGDDSDETIKGLREAVNG